MDNGSVLSREKILGAQDLKYDEVDVPEWGGKVRIRSLTATERAKFEEHTYRVTQRVGAEGVNVEFFAHLVRLRLCVLTIVDENGNRMFADDEEDVLGQKSATGADRVFQASSKLSGLSAQAGIEAGKGSSETVATAAS